MLANIIEAKSPVYNNITNSKNATNKPTVNALYIFRYEFQYFICNNFLITILEINPIPFKIKLTTNSSFYKY